jgi:DNA-binding transcriptional ArsR family regulator
LTHDIVRHVRTTAPALLPLFRSEHQLALVSRIFLGDKEQSIADLSERTGIPHSTVAREVDRLERHGLVRSHRLGRSRLVTANWDLPWAPELRSILAQTVGVLGLLAQELAGVAGIEQAFVYGSWAARHRGEPGPYPHDIDLLVVGDPERSALRQAVRNVESELRVEVNPVTVAAAEWRKPDKGSFLAQVRSTQPVAVPMLREVPV